MPALSYTALWRAADKIVYSTTLTATPTARTRLEASFDPVAVRELKEGGERDFSIGGAELAGEALRAGLVDEVRLFVVPHLVGGGTRALPERVRMPLTLRDERRFTNGTIYLRYRVES